MGSLAYPARPWKGKGRGGPLLPPSPSFPLNLGGFSPTIPNLDIGLGVCKRALVSLVHPFLSLPLLPLPKAYLKLPAPLTQPVVVICSAPTLEVNGRLVSVVLDPALLAGKLCTNSEDTGLGVSEKLGHSSRCRGPWANPFLLCALVTLCRKVC